jgi:uncharacterized membrane protein HdeD (DUF308 family)
MASAVETELSRIRKDCFMKPLHIPSFALGIVALTTCWVSSSWAPLGIPGIVCGIVAIVMAVSKKNRKTHRTKAGFVTGLIGVIIGVIILIFREMLVQLLSIGCHLGPSGVF